METVIADDLATRRQLAACMRALGTERRERIWFGDAEAVDAILFVVSCWAGTRQLRLRFLRYVTCAEFLRRAIRRTHR